MTAFRPTRRLTVASRTQRLDPRQESRFSLALILLMGLAMLSVMATTKVLVEKPRPAPVYSQR